jgi:hypothetical protein
VLQRPARAGWEPITPRIITVALGRRRPHAHQSRHVRTPLGQRPHLGNRRMGSPSPDAGSCLAAVSRHHHGVGGATPESTTRAERPPATFERWPTTAV